MFPRGAEFHLCALQVNPHHYNETFRGKEAAGNAESHAKAIVAKAVELGVSVLAITDHNNVSGVEAFRNAADGYGITIFPGFELSSSEGIHILCIYPPDTEKETLERYLGDFGIYETESTSDLSNLSFVEILKKVRTHNGISIAAHATNNSGLFSVLDGKARIKAWQSKDLLAIQIPGPVNELPQSEQQIVKNKNPRLPTPPRSGGESGGGRGQRKGRREFRGPGRSFGHVLDQDVRNWHRGPAAGFSRSGIKNPDE